MATVWATKLGSGYNFAPGSKVVWTWYNAPSDTVYSFSVQPHLIDGYMDTFAGDGKAAVTYVNYYTIKQSYEAPKRQVHIEVTNTGSSTIHYDLFMSQTYP
jgi:hypothetical protein